MGAHCFGLQGALSSEDGKRSFLSGYAVCGPGPRLRGVCLSRASPGERFEHREVSSLGKLLHGESAPASQVQVG